MALGPGRHNVIQIGDGHEMPQESLVGSDLSLIEAHRLTVALRKFADDRNWGQFHSPKNLVMALTGEVGELTEIFQWMTEQQSWDACKDPAVAPKVEQELADVLLYLIRLADTLGVDLNRVAVEKLKLNAKKYPVALAFGSSKKYDQL